jgi:hypothetical protein
MRQNSISLYTHTMQELRRLETTVLLDLLATNTAGYLRMLNTGAREEEFAKCYLTIRAIQAEIEFRKKTANQASSVDYEIDVSPEESK